MSESGAPPPDAGWSTVPAKAKPKRKHYYNELQARQIEMLFKVANLAAALRCPEAEALFSAGWVFDCVVKGNEPAPITDDANFEYTNIAIADNRWNDQLRCRRPLWPSRETRDAIPGDDRS